MIKQNKRKRGRGKALKLGNNVEQACRVKLVPISPINAIKENIDIQLQQTNRLPSACTLPKIHICSNVQLIKTKEGIQNNILKERTRGLVDARQTKYVELPQNFRQATEVREELPAVAATTGLLQNFVTNRFGQSKGRQDDPVTHRINSPKHLNMFERPRVGQAFRTRMHNNDHQSTNFWGIVTKNVSSIKKKDESELTQPSITMSGFEV